MKEKCLHCILYKQEITRFVKHLVEKGVLSLNEDTIKSMINDGKTPDAIRGTRTLADLERIRQEKKEQEPAGEDPPAGYKPILDLRAPKIESKPPEYRHKCIDERCGSVRVNRNANGQNCLRCGSPMVSTLVNKSQKRYKRRKGAAGKKASPAPDQAPGKQEPRGLDALFEKAGSPGMVSG